MDQRFHSFHRDHVHDQTRLQKNDGCFSRPEKTEAETRKQTQNKQNQHQIVVLIFYKASARTTYAHAPVKGSTALTATMFMTKQDSKNKDIKV